MQFPEKRYNNSTPGKPTNFLTALKEEYVMLKKGLSLLLVFALIVFFPGQTSAVVSGDDAATINTSARIAELYDLRAELALNYKENREAIEEIDQKNRTFRSYPIGLCRGSRDIQKAECRIQYYSHVCHSRYIGKRYLDK